MEHYVENTPYFTCGLTNPLKRCILIHIRRCKVRTNVVLDENLLGEALRLSKAKTKKQLIHEALKEFVENRKRLNLLDLSGKIKFAEGYDYRDLYLEQIRQHQEEPWQKQQRHPSEFVQELRVRLDKQRRNCIGEARKQPPRWGDEVPLSSR